MLIGMTTKSVPPEQMTLLPETDAPVRFRLDDATRRRGLRHVAEIRAQIERQRTTAVVASTDPRLDRTAA